MNLRYLILVFLIAFPVLAYAESVPVFGLILAKISVTPPSYDGYLLGSKLGSYGDLQCKHYSESHRKTDTKGSVFWSPAETVCRPLHPTHQSYGDFEVKNEEFIYRGNVLVQIIECMDNKQRFTGQAVEKNFDIGPKFSGRLHLGKNERSEVARVCLFIKAKDISVLNGGSPAATTPR